MPAKTDPDSSDARLNIHIHPSPYAGSRDKWDQGTCRWRSMCLESSRFGVSSSPHRNTSTYRHPFLFSLAFSSNVYALFRSISIYNLSINRYFCRTWDENNDIVILFPTILPSSFQISQCIERLSRAPLLYLVYPTLVCGR